MANYKKMYATLCGAIDDVIDELEKIPLAIAAVNRLKGALLATEEMYIQSEAYIEDYGQKVIELKTDQKAHAPD